MRSSSQMSRLHPDSRPSLHAYPDPVGGWACFSAKCWRGDRPNGGDIYDLAGQLWGLSTRGPDFPKLRRRLYALFLPGIEPPARRPAAARATGPAYDDYRRQWRPSAKSLGIPEPRRRESAVTAAAVVLASLAAASRTCPLRKKPESGRGTSPLADGPR